MTPTNLDKPVSSGWWVALSNLCSKSEQSRVLGGSLVMLIGSVLVNVVNVGYNVAVARLLGPAGFGHAAAAVTMLMLLSAIALSFQLVCAKFIARNQTDSSRAAVYTTLRRRAWFVGLLLGGILILASGPVAAYLNLPTPQLVMVLAIGIAFYIPLGVKRGGLQGICAFGRLSVNFILEVVVKFVGTILLIELGAGVIGAVAAISASVILAYFFPLNPPELERNPKMELPPSFREGIQAIVFFVGQVIINNVDILLVKHFFESREAGIYAAIALVGRVVYMLSWSVVSAMFPISASARRDEPGEAVVVVPLLIVLAIATVATLGLGVFPDLALHVLFGSTLQAGHGALKDLLVLNAASTGAYSLAMVLMAYEMSRKIANTGWIQLGCAAATVLGIYSIHGTLLHVMYVQLVLRILLLVCLVMPFLRKQGSRLAEARVLEEPNALAMDEILPAHAAPTTAAADLGMAGSAQLAMGLTRLRPVVEAEVIAEFLKSEFYHSEFDRDRAKFQAVVTAADISNEAENTLRRALLFRRRGAMWRELPQDTAWWEVSLSPGHVDKIRIFPRAQWRKFASGSFLLKDVVACIQSSCPTAAALSRGSSGRSARAHSAFVAGLQALSARLRTHPDRSGILLIGIDQNLPLTIIEGNHRMAAAMLAGPEIAVQCFRFFCGFSARMNECCWYQTTLANLYRYARNRLASMVDDHEAEIARFLHHEDRPLTDLYSDAVNPVAAQKSAGSEGEAA